MMHNPRVKKANNGSALIVVLCVLALLVTLSAALLVSTHSVVNNNAQYTNTIQCKLLNQSFGRGLTETIVNSNPESFGGKLVTLTAGGMSSKEFTLKDDVSGAEHNISIKVNKYNETNKEYEMFVTVDTFYKDEHYSQTMRFTSSKYTDTFIWALANTEKTETGGDPT